MNQTHMDMWRAVDNAISIPDALQVLALDYIREQWELGEISSTEFLSHISDQIIFGRASMAIDETAHYRCEG